MFGGVPARVPCAGRLAIVQVTLFVRHEEPERVIALGVLAVVTRICGVAIGSALISTGALVAASIAAMVSTMTSALFSPGGHASR